MLLRSGTGQLHCRTTVIVTNKLATSLAWKVVQCDRLHLLHRECITVKRGSKGGGPPACSSLGLHLQELRFGFGGARPVPVLGNYQLGYT